MLAQGVSCHTSSIIHETGSQTTRIRSEIELGYPPVEAEIFAEGEALPPQSWVDYAIFSYVDFSAYVLIIGRVVPWAFDSIVSRAARELSSHVAAGQTRDNTNDEFSGSEE